MISGIGTNSNIYLRISNLSKRFGTVQALDKVSFELDRGEVVALLGQNGAGKSTLAKILAGIVKPDSGKFELNESLVDYREVSKIVAMVQQELSLVPTLSASENIFLGGHFQGSWTQKRLSQKAKKYLDMVGLENLDPSIKVNQLSLAEKQLIELARAISRDAEIVILDEPTAALSDAEIIRVQAVVRSLSKAGKGIIFITHRLSEVFEIADKAIVIQNGQSQIPVRVSNISLDNIIEMMLGRSLEKMFPEKIKNDSGNVVCEIKELVTPEISTPISFTINKGQIIGLAGQIGCGMTSVLQTIAGLQERLSGDVYLNGQSIHPETIRQGIELGIAFCSSERRIDGLFMNRPLIENLTAPSIKWITPRGILNRKKQDSLSLELADFFQIDKLRLKHQASTLSGGNQQKVTVGKWIGIKPKLLLIEEPTRGVDVGARAEIYQHLRLLADSGLPIIFSSTDLQEILGFADIVMTFYRGQLIRVANAKGLTEAQVIKDVTHSRKESV